MKHSRRGFTVIELLITILVVGILLAMAIPSFREVASSNRITASANDLVTALATARSEALRRSAPVSVCASTTGVTCVGAATSLTDWSGGWIAFTDGGTAGTIDGTDETVQRWAAAAGDTKLNGSASYITYTSTGRLTAARNFNVYFYGCVDNKGRHVDVTVIGLVTTTRQTPCP